MKEMDTNEFVQILTDNNFRVIDVHAQGRCIVVKCPRESIEQFLKEYSHIEVVHTVNGLYHYFIMGHS